MLGMGIMYGFDTGHRAEEAPFAVGEEVAIEVVPYKRHLLERFVVTAATMECVIPVSLAIGRRYSQDYGKPSRAALYAGDLNVVREEDEQTSIRLSSPALVDVMDQVILTLRITKPISRLTFTAVAALHPADIALGELFAALREQEHAAMARYDDISVSAFEQTARERGNPPPPSDWLELAPPKMPTEEELESFRQAGAAAEALRVRQVAAAEILAKAKQRDR